jgi:hypothetical protein
MVVNALLLAILLAADHLEGWRIPDWLVVPVVIAAAPGLILGTGVALVFGGSVHDFNAAIVFLAAAAVNVSLYRWLILSILRPRARSREARGEHT